MDSTIQWKQWIESDNSQFFTSLKTKLHKQDFSEAEKAIECLTGYFFLMFEMRDKLMLQGLTSHTKELATFINRIPDKKAKLHKVKGQLEVLHRLGHYAMLDIPDEEEFLILEDKHCACILVHNHSRHVSSIMDVSSTFDIPYEDVRKKVNFLSENEFIERRSNGEREMISNTKKGDRIAKHFSQKHGLLRVPSLLKKTRDLFENKKTYSVYLSELKIETKEHPELSLIYRHLMELGKLRKVYQPDIEEAQTYHQYIDVKSLDKEMMGVGMSWHGTKKV